MFRSRFLIIKSENFNSIKSIWDRIHLLKIIKFCSGWFLPELSWWWILILIFLIINKYLVVILWALRLRQNLVGRNLLQWYKWWHLINSFSSSKWSRTKSLLELSLLPSQNQSLKSSFNDRDELFVTIRLQYSQCSNLHSR